MNTGALKCVIDIYSKNAAQQENGYIDPAPEKLCTARARRMDASTREVWEAYAAKARSIVNWEMRYRAGVEVGQTVSHQGAEYEIIAVQRPAGLPHRMILKTTLKEAK